MARKIVFSSFGGVIPKVPDHALPATAASYALNVRLTDGTIRPYYPPSDSGVGPNVTLSTMSTNYYNMVKASHDTNQYVAWLAWSAPDVKITVLETRYNDVEVYVKPVVIAAPTNGVLTVLLSGATVVLTATGYVATFIHAYFGSSAPFPTTILNTTQQITGAVEIELAPIASYSWAYVSGDTTIVIDDPAVATPTFTLPVLPAPTSIGTSSVTAVWRLTILDSANPANDGWQDVVVNFSYRWGAPPIFDENTDL